MGSNKKKASVDDWKEAHVDDWKPVDDWAPVAEAKESSMLEKVQAFTDGLGNQLTLGHAPNLSAMAEPITDRVLSAVTGKEVEAAPMSQALPWTKEYIVARDRNEKTSKKIADDNPKSSMAGNATGFVGSLAIPAGPMLKVAGSAPSIAARIAASAGSAGIASGLQNPGNVEGKAELGSDLKKRAVNTAVGSLFGAGIGGASAPAVQKVAGKAIETGKNALSKIKPMFDRIEANVSGIPEQVLARFKNDPDKINALIKKSGNGEDIVGLADEARGKISSQIGSFKSTQNNQISAVLEKLDDSKSESITGIVERLNKERSKLNSKLRGDEISEIESVISKIQSVADESGNVSQKELFEIKDYLQDAASGSYMKNGQIFSSGKSVAKAAKYAAADARKQLYNSAPEFVEPFKNLERLRVMEKRINKNLIGEGKNASGFFSAGSGANANNAKQLSDLDKLTGSSSLELAKDLAAARAFAKPDLISNWTTGRSMTGSALGGPLGFMMGGPAGGAMGALAPLLASPGAIKARVGMTNAVKKGASYLGDKLPELTATGSMPALARQTGISNVSPVIAAALGSYIAQAPKDIMGYPENSLVSIPPDQTGMMTAKINNDRNMSVTEKANRITLLNTHGMLPSE